jgi:large subunit ribosomal protein L22
MITASLKNYRITPRKVRLVADMIRGKRVIDAEAILAFALKKAKSPLGDLLGSAVANAKNNFNIEKDVLYVKEIMVNQGYVLKRSMPVSRGSAHPIKKRTSHVKLVLAVKPEKKSKK